MRYEVGVEPGLDNLHRLVGRDVKPPVLLLEDLADRATLNAPFLRDVLLAYARCIALIDTDVAAVEVRKT